MGSIQHSCDPTDTTIQISIRTRSICRINLPACSIKLPNMSGRGHLLTQSQQTGRSLATGITGLRTTIDNGGCRSLSLQKSVYSESRVPRAKNPSRSTPQISNENNESRKRIGGKSPTTSPPPSTGIHSPLLRGTAPPLQPPTGQNLEIHDVLLQPLNSRIDHSPPSPLNQNGSINETLLISHDSRAIRSQSH